MIELILSATIVVGFLTYVAVMIKAFTKPTPQSTPIRERLVIREVVVQNFGRRDIAALLSLLLLFSMFALQYYHKGWALFQEEISILLTVVSFMGIALYASTLVLRGKTKIQLVRELEKEVTRKAREPVRRRHIKRSRRTS